MMYPINEQELQNIQGVGAGKAKRYGKEFCELIKQHCEENNIERPEELRVRNCCKEVYAEGKDNSEYRSKVTA